MSPDWRAVNLRVLALGNVYPPHHLGGYELIWHGVSEELRAQGHATRILTSTHRNPEVSEPDPPDVHRVLEWYWRDHVWPAFTLRERRRIERHNRRVLGEQIAAFAPDVLAGWALGGMSLSALAQARRAGLPVVLFVLDPWPAYGPRHDLWRRLRGPLAASLDGPWRWVFCSRAMERATLALGLRCANRTILPPGIDARYLTELTGPARSWRGRLLYLGRVVEQKGVLDAVRALAELPETTLRIVGDGDGAYRAHLEGEAARLGVRGRIEFVPAVGREATVLEYEAADALVFPVAWDEPFGLVPLEAMARGLPVLATGRGGSGDYLRDGENCLRFAAGDAAALAAAVRRLAGDRELRARLRAGGRATAEAHPAEAFNRAAVAELARARTRSEPAR
jgi:glycosyltransferase involved in cell wall biosynthesis